MSEKNDGGPAFGQVVELRCVHVEMGGSTEWEPEAMMHGGLTVRDYFAAKELGKVNAISVCDMPKAYERIADHCYRMADAMLKERSK